MTSLWLDTHPIQERGVAVEPGERHDTIVVGAGLTGLVTAVLLARAGQRVCVLEARAVGAVTTGNTTAKLSLLQGSNLSTLRRHHGDDVLTAHVTGNLAAKAWLLEFLDESAVPYQTRTAYTYTLTDHGLRCLDAELDAAVASGLPANWADDAGLPYPIAAAIELPGQAQFHPTEVLDALLVEFLQNGGALHTGCRVRAVDAGPPCTVSTSQGALTADQVVLATGAPILDRGAHFARLQAQRSYALAFRVPGSIPQGMYLSVDQPARSLRTAPVNGEELLLVGGNGHPVGRHGSTGERVADLADWAGRYFPGAERTHSWSAQDYHPAAGLPLVGELPRSGGRIHVATGYDKWGMTNAVAAALRLTARLTRKHLDWAGVLDRATVTPADLVEGARLNAEVAGVMTGGWLAAEGRSLPTELPREGEAVVGRHGLRPAGRSTVAGRTCTVSAVCTHLGGVLAWNDAEQSWDCPLHGSRFDSQGRVLEGPAVIDLEVLD